MGPSHKNANSMGLSFTGRVESVGNGPSAGRNKAETVKTLERRTVVL